MYLYHVITTRMVSIVLLLEIEKIQHLVYFVSQVLTYSKGKYSVLEKLSFILKVIAQKLRHYVRSYIIIVMTSYMLKNVLSQLEVSGRLAHISIKLGKYDIKFHPRIAIKA